MTSKKAEAIRKQNDLFRKGDLSIPGTIVFTHGLLEHLQKLSLGTKDVVSQLRSYEGFDAINDPHGEHDFGAFEIGEEKCFWKIDYYDVGLTYGSPDPSDLSKTKRVLTVMLAKEY